MVKNKTSRKNLIIAVILLIAPVYIQGLWIYVSSLDVLKNQEDKSAFYYSHFPPLLRGHYPLVLIALFCSVASLFLIAGSLNKTENKLRWIAYTALIISLLAGFLSLFQMM
jgi:hypothetical protein